MPQFFVSPCCRGRIIKFGQRRRQCTICLRTWSIKLKKRGRKRLRINRQMVSNYLKKKLPSVKVKHLNRESIRRRMRLSLSKYLNFVSWEYPPNDTDLIVVADGMHEILEKQPFVVYLILLRPVNSNQAWIMPPVIVQGGESAVGWLKALNSIPESFKKRIKALVCDGDPHLVYQAKLRGLIVQRCHFHLLASIKNYVSAGPLSRNPPFGKLVLTTVQQILVTKYSKRLSKLVTDVKDLIRLAKNRKLRARLRGLLKHLNDFHAYQEYPKLNLPTTSNSAESLVQCVRDLLYRARGFRTVKSFSNWLNAICVLKKTIVCNAKYQQKKGV